MSKLMLIDAVHPEETRVALATDGRVDDFDFEAEGKQQLRGNIYLAKVTRVEPSLQAAFIEYGGNRHGFLAFSEIHPDYYQLPQEDREALLREEAEAAAAAAEEDDDEVDLVEDGDETDDDDALVDAEAEEAAETEDASEAGDDETDGSEATERKKTPRRTHPSRRYKIQEVIRRRQVMLVQVVKEERGNKGAALTTYLSLAGRYCVLMPNTPRGGGISRKISSAADRRRLKTITKSLDVPQGMGLIVRTAGAKRTKTDIKRDFEYLQKLWDKIRDLTLNSIAPTLINEEGNLVHRAMRDLYDKDINEVLVQGPDAYREAKDLAKLLMPSQAKKVKQWKDQSPLFVAKDVESQLDSIFSPVVQLKSGGYLVINQTEALVAIDVNSGKATRGRNIEQTATNTNIEAAEEACRQMRLRDLAGLIVIDFIDMEENKNIRQVEKKLKDCLKLDRARVQHG
ncbi:MAG: Rne/Rng family ribonuclease, partial [Pseudomonadota bacterium]